MNTLKSPWFWLALIALAAGAYFLLTRGKNSSIGAVGKFAPSAPPPPGQNFASDVNALTGFLKQAQSIWDA